VTTVDSNYNFKIKTKSNNLILLRHDLTGNYKIDREESEKILEGIEMYRLLKGLHSSPFDPLT